MANSQQQFVFVCLSVLVACLWTAGGVAEFSDTDQFDYNGFANMSNITTPSSNTTTMANVTTPMANMTTPMANVTTPVTNMTTPFSNVTTPSSNMTTDSNMTTIITPNTTLSTTLAPTTPSTPSHAFSIGSFFGGIALGIVVAVCSALLVRWYINRRKGFPYRTV